MKRLPLASLLLLVSVWSAEAASNITPLPRPRLTPEMIAALKRTPNPVPPAAETGPAPVVLAVDPAVIDRARSEIVRMAPYIVNQRPNLPSSGQVLTRKGKLEVAMKRNPGLKFLSFWGLNNKVALAMYEDELRRERMREAADLWSLYLVK